MKKFHNTSSIVAILSLFVVVLTFTSCGDEPSKRSSTDVYVCGSTVVNNKTLAAYWKNGEITTITDETTDYALGILIAVEGDNIYVVYNEFVNGNFALRLWKNGVVTALTDGTHQAEAYGIAILNGTANVVGLEKNDAGIQVATLWYNGIAISLTDGSFHAQARDIIVFNGDLYIAGVENAVAKYWKNGSGSFSVSDLTAPFACATSIATNSESIYVAGYEGNASGVSVAKLWRDGEAPINLTDGTFESYASDLVVDGDNTYVAGTEEHDTYSSAVFWKNGTRLGLTGAESDAYAFKIAVSGKDVYVMGSLKDGNLPMLWKNGVAQPPFDGTLESTIVNGLCVVRQ